MTLKLVTMLSYRRVLTIAIAAFCFIAPPAFSMNLSNDSGELLRKVVVGAKEHVRTGQVSNSNSMAFSYIAALLKNSTETRNTAEFNQILDTLSQPNVLDFLTETQAQHVFADGVAGNATRFILQVLQVQRSAELKRHLLNANDIGRTLIRFQLSRSPFDLELILKLDRGSSVFDRFMLETQFDLISFLTGKNDLKETLIARALYEVTPQNISAPSKGAEKFLEQIRFRGGTANVISGEDLIRQVARRVYENDASLAKREGIAWMFETSDLSLRRSPQAKLRTSALTYLLKTELFSLQDFDRMVSEMKQGVRWNEAFLFGSGTVPTPLVKALGLLRMSLRNSLKAAGYPGIEGFARYLAERHGLSLQTVTPNWESAMLIEVFEASKPTDTSKPIEAWRMLYLRSPGLYVEFTNQSASPNGVRLTVLGRHRSDREHTQTELRSFVDGAAKFRSLAKSSISLLRCEILFTPVAK